MKTALVLSLGLLIVMAMRRQAAAMRHWILAVTIACAAAVPLLGDDRSALGVVIPHTGRARSARPPGERRRRYWLCNASAGRSGDTDLTAGQCVASLWRWLARIRWAGAAIGLIGLAVGLIRLRRIVRRATPVTSGRVWDRWIEARAEIGITRPVRLLQSDSPAAADDMGAAAPHRRRAADRGRLDRRPASGGTPSRAGAHPACATGQR